MSDLSSSCGCGCGCERSGCGNNTLFLILILLCCTGDGCFGGIGNAFNGGGCGGNNSCDLLIWILLISCLCGNNSGCGGGCGGCGSCGC
ncbi:MAG: hypothetical protein PUF59_05055 [Lachnospiraceae bacterium]|nr:hypothetical protein [Cuneatibacter sp.]MDD6455940.1 hypothetical protein [Lachnospiraceae bacterium]